jgi:hypothetical protein
VKYHCDYFEHTTQRWTVKLGVWTDVVVVVGSASMEAGQMRLLQLLYCCAAPLRRTVQGWYGRKRTVGSSDFCGPCHAHAGNSVFYTVRAKGLYGDTSQARERVVKEQPFKRKWAWKQRNSHCWSRYQATTGHDTANWKDLACAVVICKVRTLAMAL